MKCWKSFKGNLQSNSRSRKREQRLHFVHNESAGGDQLDGQGPEADITQSTESLQEPKEPGLHLIYNGSAAEDQSDVQGYEVDIIAIHGLNGTAYGTWTHEDGTLWLRDLLPEDIPKARIFTYSYPAELFWSRSEATITDYAQNLLALLQIQRREQSNRPIIFLAHSLGGIVCKQALIKANENPRFKILLESTVGIVFFGTPHRGADTELGKFVGNICKISGVGLIGGGARNDLLNVLKKNSVKLRDIAGSFRHISGRFQIVTVYELERHPILDRLIVDESSAQMDIDNEIPIPAYATHTGICRFRRRLHGSTDQAYERVRHELQEMCKKKFTLTTSEKVWCEKFKDSAVEDYASSISKPVGGTCEWILADQGYDFWVQASGNSLFWISGYAGSGKSVLANFITRRLEKSTFSNSNTIICSFFCSSALSDAKSIVRRIIYQILQRQGGLVRHVLSALEKDLDEHRLFENYDRLWSIFLSILKDSQFVSITIIIDALDECNEQTIQRFMESLGILVEDSRHLITQRVQLLITSRPDLAIDSYFTKYKPQRLALEDRGSNIDSDLGLVIEERLENLAGRLSLHQGNLSEIKNYLAQHADRNFLWVIFALELLEKGLRTNPGDFHRVLSGLPKKLQETYTRFFHEIEIEDRDFARTILSAVIGSYRPLVLEELNIIISMAKSQQNACRNMMTLKKEFLHVNLRVDVERVLGPLIKIFDSRVYLIHFSLKEFLCGPVPQTSNGKRPQREYMDIGRAHIQLASACISYLLLDDFTKDLYSEAKSATDCQSIAPLEASGMQERFEHSEDVDDAVEDESLDGYIYGNTWEKFEKLDSRVLVDVKNRYTLLEYAATFWGQHLAECQDLASEKLNDLAIRLTDRRSNCRYSNWLRLHLAGTQWAPGDPWHWDQFAIAGYFGHLISLDILLDRTLSIRDESLAMALYFASRHGHEKCVVRLLKTNVKPDSCRPNGQSALCSAALNGHLGVVKALAAHPDVDVNYKGFAEIRPLGHAAHEGHLDVVDFLLRQPHVDPNAGAGDGTVAIYDAVHAGHREVALRLARDGRADVNYSDNPDGAGRRIIDRFVLESNEDAIALLLQLPRVDVNSPCSLTGRTPLAEAASYGYTAIIEQFGRSRKLDRSHSHKDRDGRSAISLAAGHGFDQAVNLLIKYRIPGIDEKDYVEEWTPLIWALKSPTNTAATVKCLLNGDEVNPNQTDKIGRTAVCWAVHCNDAACLQLLLSTEGIDPSIPDNDGVTPLDWARKLEDRSSMIMTLESYSQPNS
ncbi:hypothetical protein ACLMJK_006901 [Lecanora helva]